MKILKKRLRSLAAVWLSVIMLMSFFAVGASAASPETLDFYIGTGKIHKDASLWNLVEGDIGSYEVDTAEPLSEMENIDDILCGRGGDLAGWTLWLEEGSGEISDESLEVDADVVLDNIPTSTFENTFRTYDSQYDDLDNFFYVPRINVKYFFTRQPTVDAPMIDTNVDGIYTWQTPVFSEKKAVHSRTPDDDEFYLDELNGSYNSATGKWESGTASAGCVLRAEAYLQPGEKIVLTLPDGFDGEVIEEISDEALVKNGNTYTLAHNERIEFYREINITSDTPFSAEIKVIAREGWKDVDGQTAKTYTGEPAVVRAKASFENGKYEIWSDEVLLGDCWIIRQPTDDDPSVTVNAPDKVDGYQWHSYKEVSGNFSFAENGKIADKELPTAEVTEEDQDNSGLFELINEYLFSGKYFAIGEYVSDGKWKGNPIDPDSSFTEYSLAFIVPVKNGGKLSFTAEGNDDVRDLIATDPNLSGIEDLYTITVQLHDNIDSLLYANAENIAPTNGVYTLSDDMYIAFVSINIEVDGITVKPVYETAESYTEEVSGQNSKTYSAASDTVLAEVRLKNGGSLYSDSVTVTQSGEGGSDESTKVPVTSDDGAFNVAALILFLSALAFVYSAKALKTAK